MYGPGLKIGSTSINRGVSLRESYTTLYEGWGQNLDKRTIHSIDGSSINYLVNNISNSSKAFVH
ncbi:hypothetical protein ES332_A11G117000v1 [Gossypium tomentosum]|uniref:Uncharacterized protein n=1 Tax=Gossypium tomentosum TaxID=34277 RepID=A0A5D2N9S9_GOSTO|nr:hypothetical protein ES332_A11G117000v1 [Gossypium tomentosum]